VEAQAALGPTSRSTRTATAPPGFPQDVPSCPGETDINDDVGLQLTIRAPSNVQSYSYEFKFHSYEFPEYVCTQFNDQYIALVNPAPQGSINGNISFDSNTNPVSVNIAFFDVCSPSTSSEWALICSFDFGSSCPPLPNPYCPSGPAELAGNGLRDLDGATSWLVTTAPVEPGQRVHDPLRDLGHRRHRARLHGAHRQLPLDRERRRRGRHDTRSAVS
jgi:hypothetical protein